MPSFKKESTKMETEDKKLSQQEILATAQSVNPSAPRSLAPVSSGKKSLLVSTEVQSSEVSKPKDTLLAVKPEQAGNSHIKDAFPPEVNPAFKFCFLGLGQGGGRIANTFHGLGYRRVGVLNTTSSDFFGLSPDLPKLDLKTGGAAKDTAAAEEVISKNEDALWELLERAWGSGGDYGMICASLGGGTGSGMITKAVKVARKYMAQRGASDKVGVVVSLPSSTEGALVCKNAMQALASLLSLQVSPLIIIDNAKVSQLYRPVMSKLYETANATACQLLHLFNILCEAPQSIISFDKAEFSQILDGGIVAMGAADLSEATTPAEVQQAIREELVNNVLVEVDTRTGRRGCCVFAASQSSLDNRHEEFFAAGYNQLERLLGAAYVDSKLTPVVHRGLTVAAEEGIQAYVMLSGVELPQARIKELATKANISTAQMEQSISSFLGIK